MNIPVSRTALTEEVQAIPNPAEYLQLILDEGMPTSINPPPALQTDRIACLGSRSTITMDGCLYFLRFLMLILLSIPNFLRIVNFKTTF